MATEIERKFLVKSDAWKPSAGGVLYRQGYLSTAPERTVRVRLAAQQGFITVKGLSVGIARPEFEYAIPASDAAAMLDGLCVQPLIEKMRYRVAHGGHVWEVDEFFGDNLGLVIAEVELGAVDEPLDVPDWVGAEVSDDARYYNSSLIAHPYRRWASP